MQKSLPSELSRILSGYKWSQNHIGFSSAQVFRLEAENKSPLYLKIDSRFSSHSLLEEKLKLEWLKDRIPVPEIICFAEDTDLFYLLSSAIAGIDAADDSFKTNIPNVIEQLTNGLKMIHNLPIKNCPFDMRLDYKIKVAEDLMKKGLVDEEDFDEERQGRTAEDLFQELIISKPTEEDLVFTHGDYCVPNIIFENGKLNGFVDWSGAGVADRYQDLALLSRSIQYNFGKKWEEKVFEIYGIEPDWQKVHFYRLLDEFF